MATTSAAAISLFSSRLNPASGRNIIRFFPRAGLPSTPREGDVDIQGNAAPQGSPQLRSSSLPPVDPAIEIARLQKELSAIDFASHTGNRDNVGALAPGLPLFEEFGNALDLFEQIQRLKGETIFNEGGTIGGPNTPGEVAKLGIKLQEGELVKARKAPTSIQREQIKQTGLIAAKGKVQAKEREARTRIITAGAAGPQTLFKRADEIPKALRLGGGVRA